MRYTVIYEEGPRNHSALVPMLPVVIITGKTMEELERNAREAIAYHLEGTPQEGEPVEVELVRHEDYDGDLLTLDGGRIPAKPLAEARA